MYNYINMQNHTSLHYLNFDEIFHVVVQKAIDIVVDNAGAGSEIARVESRTGRGGRRSTRTTGTTANTRN